MLDLIEILKDAPKGKLMLYSPVFGDVLFVGFSESGSGKKFIEATDKNGDVWCFYPDGRLVQIEKSECILFPSFYHRNWENWQDILFTTGDVIYDENADRLYIKTFDSFDYNILDNGKKFKSAITTDDNCKNTRYATKFERSEFFTKLHENGYAWDEQAKQVVCVNSFNSDTEIKEE